MHEFRFSFSLVLKYLYVISQNNVYFSIFHKKKKTNESQKSNKPSKPSKPALCEVKATDLFGNGPIKRTEPVVKKLEPKVSRNTETAIHSDDDFEKSLLEIDGLDEIVEQNNKRVPEQWSKKEVPEQYPSKDKKTKHSLTNVKPKTQHNDKNSPTKKTSSKYDLKQKNLETKKIVDNLKKEIKDTNKRKFEQFLGIDNKEEVNKKKKSDDCEISNSKEVNKKKKIDDCEISNSIINSEKTKIDIKTNDNVTVKTKTIDLDIVDSAIEYEADQFTHKKKRINKSLNESGKI